jgi:hypothetical protein
MTTTTIDAEARNGVDWLSRFRNCPRKKSVAGERAFSSLLTTVHRLKSRPVMKIVAATWAGGAAILLGIGGCARDPNRIGVTNPRHPGPAAGRAIGAGVGVVGGNVAGAVVGAGEGVAQGASAPFNNTTRVVRRWRTEVTSDGRTIQVPEDMVVDQYGRPVNPPAATPATPEAKP